MLFLISPDSRITRDSEEFKALAGLDDLLYAVYRTDENMSSIYVPYFKNNVQSSNTASSFFPALDAVTYAPPQPDSSSGGPSQLSVTISHTAVDADTHRYSVLSAATDGKTSRRIMGLIDISFVPVTQTGGFAPLGGR